MTDDADSWGIYEMDGQFWFRTEWDPETQEGDELRGPFDTEDEAIAAAKQQ
jgi:hypothetical protein